MNIQETFSPENTSHLETEGDKRMHLEAALQYAWLETHPDIVETEFLDRSRWFREEFLTLSDAEEILGRFKEAPEAVLDTLESRYLASVSKH